MAEEVLDLGRKMTKLKFLGCGRCEGGQPADVVLITNTCGSSISRERLFVRTDNVLVHTTWERD